MDRAAADGFAAVLASHANGIAAVDDALVKPVKLLLLGLVAGLALSGEALVLTGTATLGSYTTFSTWMLETQRLGESGRVRAAALNVVASIALGVAAVALGRTVGAQL